MSCWSSAARGWAPDGTGAEGWGAQQGCEWPQLLLGSRGRWLGSVARASLLLFVPAPWDRTSDPRSSCVFLLGTLLTLLHVLCFPPGLVFFPFPPFSIWFSLPLSSAALGPSFPCQSIHPVLG